MACPFVRHADSLPRQNSVADHGNWGIEDDLVETTDALTLTHLQNAIQLLTAPSVRLFPRFVFVSIRLIGIKLYSHPLGLRMTMWTLRWFRLLESTEDDGLDCPNCECFNSREVVFLRYMRNHDFPGKWIKTPCRSIPTTTIWPTSRISCSKWMVS